MSKLAQRPETLHRAKPIFAFFHAYEAQYGELSQMTKLEKRMSDYFPEDPLLSRFARRYALQGFDPTAVRPIISPRTQTRPKALPSIEDPTAHHQQVPPPPQQHQQQLQQQPQQPQQPIQQQPSPRPSYAQAVDSPKRGPPADEAEADATRPRKLARGESPLKGAAGRRLDQQKRNMQSQLGLAQGAGGTPGQWSLQHGVPPPPPPLPREVLFLLSIIPGADTYAPATRFNAEAMVRLLAETDVPTKAPPHLRSGPIGSHGAFPGTIGGYILT